MEASDEVRFREVQRAGRPWWWVIAIMAVTYGGVILALYLSDEAVRAKDLWAVGVGVAVMVGVTFLLLGAKLETEVRGDGVYVRLFPFHLSFREIPLEDVVKVEARSYRPLREYGGWGIRCGRKGRAYNMSGNEGVRIDYANERHMLIGSQRSEELAAAIEEVLKRKT